MTDPRVRVLHVIPGLGYGGAENMLAALVTDRRAGRPEAIVADLLDGGPYAAPIAAAEVPLHTLRMGRGVPNPGVLWRLARLIRRHRPDVVQGWMYYGDIAATLALRLSGRRRATRLYWGIRCSNIEVDRYGFGLRAAIAACRRMSAAPDAIVANSEVGRRVHEAMGYRARAFHVIENGIDTARFRPDAAARCAARAELGLADGEVVAIHVGRRDPQKDHETLLAAAAQVSSLRLLVVGLGTDTLPLPDNVTALGPRGDMPRLYNAADIVVGSSAFGEGFPTVLAEGMASGLVPVGTDVGDTGRLVGAAGFVVPPREPAMLAKALRTLVAASPAERAERGKAARRLVEANFALRTAIDTFDRLHRDGTGPCAG